MRRGAAVGVEVHYLAAKILGRMRPGSDARDIALSAGLRVCPHPGPTAIRGGVLFYRDRYYGRELDRQIGLCLARHVLRRGASAMHENVDELAVRLMGLQSDVVTRAG